MSSTTAPVTSAALAQRLRVAAGALLPEPPTPTGEVWTDAAVLLEQLVRFVARDPRPEYLWLLYVAVSTTFPTPDELSACAREFELRTPDQAMFYLLDAVLANTRQCGDPELEIELVTGGVLVEVDFSSRHDIHTGIQRVVRSTVPRWHRDHDLRLVAWTPGRAALRTLAEPETARILRWGDDDDIDDRHPSHIVYRLVVPWRSVVVLPEVPALDTCSRLTALAESSGNRVVAIGYDCIPVVSADLVPIAEPNRFVRYLTVVKYLHRVAGISVSATAEFRGFADMLGTQGLPGPTVVECALPVDAADTAAIEKSVSAVPSILCVGSFEPRKNQLALLYAAETLWREGLRFELRFVGGGGWGGEFPTMVRRLVRAGRPVTVSTAIDEDELRAAYRGAWFTVFTSVHEGYGLPVAESLALGTPVVTTNYGSTAEIGLHGGTVQVDPRDDQALIDAMRMLLTDPEQLAKLREEIRLRPARSWDDYAREVWDALVPGAAVEAGA